MSNGSSFSEIDLDSLPDEDQPDSCLNRGKPFAKSSETSVARSAIRGIRSLGCKQDLGRTTMSVKQVIVIRRDLHMRQGKAVAQGAHAAMMFMIDASANERELSETEQQWFAEGITKICLRVESEQELADLIDRSRSLGLKVFPVNDAGHTEFHGTPTLTCCAIGPDNSDLIDTVTGGLKLL